MRFLIMVGKPDVTCEKRKTNLVSIDRDQIYPYFDYLVRTTEIGNRSGGRKT